MKNTTTESVLDKMIREERKMKKFYMNCAISYTEKHCNLFADLLDDALYECGDDALRLYDMACGDDILWQAYETAIKEEEERQKEEEE